MRWFDITPHKKYSKSTPKRFVKINPKTKNKFKNQKEEAQFLVEF